jgi:hypothetical protein
MLQDAEFLLSKDLDLPLTDAALFDVERLWRRFIELRARKIAALIEVVSS